MAHPTPLSEIVTSTEHFRAAAIPALTAESGVIKMGFSFRMQIPGQDRGQSQVAAAGAAPRTNHLGPSDSTQLDTQYNISQISVKKSPNETKKWLSISRTLTIKAEMTVFMRQQLTDMAIITDSNHGLPLRPRESSALPGLHKLTSVLKHCIL